MGKALPSDVYSSRVPGRDSTVSFFTALILNVNEVFPMHHTPCPLLSTSVLKKHLVIFFTIDICMYKQTEATLYIGWLVGDKSGIKRKAMFIYIKPS